MLVVKWGYTHWRFGRLGAQGKQPYISHPRMPQAASNLVMTRWLHARSPYRRPRTQLVLFGRVVGPDRTSALEGAIRFPLSTLSRVSTPPPIFIKCPIAPFRKLFYPQLTERVPPYD